MMRPALALLLLCACPADDWSESMDDSSDGSASMTTSATVSGSATAATTTAGTGTTETGTETATGTSDATTTATGTTGTTDTGADSTTGTLECDAGLEPAAITEVEGCDGPIGEPACSEGQMHVTQGTDVDWLADPPHSGPHYPTWETWGEHADVVPRGNWVHNLEHGGIVLSYKCNDDCETELDVLREVLSARPELRILLTPDPLLPGDRFAAVSWTWTYRFDAPDLDTLLCFVDQHENHAPEDVP